MRFPYLFLLNIISRIISWKISISYLKVKKYMCFCWTLLNMTVSITYVDTCVYTYVCMYLHMYMHTWTLISVYIFHTCMKDVILNLFVSSYTFHSAYFHGARRKRELIRLLSIISLQFLLISLFLVFSVLSTSEHGSCSCYISWHCLTLWQWPLGVTTI